MMKKINILILIICNIASAQQVIGLPVITPPAPEARKMIEYGNIPVNYSTGVANISIPLYKLPLKNQELSFDLSYHSAGVKVQDDGGLTGLKWFLQNGSGSINRTVNGRPDEDNTGTITGWINATDQINFSLDVDNYTNAQKSAIINGCSDLEPDEFNYSLPNGLSGKFVFTHLKKDGIQQILHVPQSKDVEIDFYGDNSLSSGWKITDKYGTTYFFNTFETNQTAIVSQFTNPCPIGSYKSSWKLDSMKLPNGELVSFNYINDNYTEVLAVSQSQVLQEPTIREHPDLALKTSYQHNSYALKLLSDISYSDYKVQFAYSDKSNNSSGGKQLNSLSVFHDLEFIKGYRLNYFYNSNNRMFLESIDKIGIDTDIDNYYVFQYDAISDLPEKESFSRDHFGYYNGRNNATLIPSGIYEIPIIYSPGNSTVFYTGADRELNLNTIKTGILKKIVYPTGGSSSFEYEPNTAFFNQENKEFQYISKNEIPDETPLGWQTSFTTFFEIAEGKFYLENVSLNAFDGPLPPSFNKPKITLMGEDGQEYGAIILFNIANNIDGTFLIENLPEQRYRFKTEIYNSDTYITAVNFRGYYEKVVSEFTNKYLGGLRVSSIENYTDGNLQNKRDFTYNSFTEPETTSGKSFGDLTSYIEEFTHYTQIGEHSPAGGGGALVVSQNFSRLLSNNNSLISRSQNSSIIYENVEEIFHGDNENYTIKRYYKNLGREFPIRSINTIGGRYFSNGYLEEYAKGILQKEEYFNESGTMVQRLENEYNFLNSSLSEDNVSVPIDRVICIDPHDYLSAIDPTKCYSTPTELISRWFARKKSTTVTFFDTHNLTQEQEWFYDNPIHKQINRTVTKTSQNRIIEQRIWYPADKSNLGYSTLSTTHSSAIDELLDLGRIAEPIQEETREKTGSTIHSQTVQRTNFKHFDNIVWPESILSLKGDLEVNNEMQSRIIFHNYDDKGNPTEVSKTDGSHIYYIWGYNKQYPVAKVENTTRAQIEALSGFGANFHIGNSSLTASQENTLRNNLPNAMVTTYTYDPLIGVTSMTDPRGYTVSYHYDAFNRLEFVKDAQGNLISENKYNYKN